MEKVASRSTENDMLIYFYIDDHCFYVVPAVPSSILLKTSSTQEGPSPQRLPLSLLINAEEV